MTDAERYAAARKMRECLGVGPATADLLVTQGLSNLSELANLTPKQVSAKLHGLVSPEDTLHSSWGARLWHYNRRKK